jgi:IPT/TIG domain
MATYRLPTEEQIQAKFAAAKPAPTVTSVTPSSGNIAGGTSVVIAGTNLTGATSVKFGTTAATNVVVNSATQIHATAPAHAAGAVSVTVTTGNGTSGANSLYTYSAPPAPTPTPSPSSGNTVVRMGPTIAIQNKCTVLTDSQITPVVAALQIQLDRDWQAAWGTTATLVFVSSNQSIPAGAWPIYILDNSDAQGALGYHDETASGVPYGRVFAKDDITYGYNWTVTLSHELLEMMLDPYVNLTVFNQTSDTAGLLYAYEACDAVEADNLGYQINGIQVSDFVWPAWFDTTITNHSGHRYDQMNHITAPFQLYSGGYIGVFQVTNGSGWSSINAEHVIGPADPDDSHGAGCCTSCMRDRRNRD